MKCTKCGTEFDPAYDFVDDVDLLEGLLAFCKEAEYWCSDCCYEVIEKMDEVVDNALGKVK